MANAIDREMLMLKTFLKGRKEQFEHITIEQYNKEIDEAMERVSKMCLLYLATKANQRLRLKVSYCILK
jgi:hypothetical protein